MGGMCSRSFAQDGNDDPEKSTPSYTMSKHTLRSQPEAHSARDVVAAKRLAAAHEANMLDRDPRAGITSWHALKDSQKKQSGFDDAQEYFASRQRLLELEETIDFDHTCRMNATSLEKRVDAIVRHLKRRDAEDVYGRAETRKDGLGQNHARFAGDHFLSNVDLINKSRLFKVAKQMPKGGHLHIHFNSCLLPNVLLDIAKEMDRMFITSTIPLTSRDSLRDCEIQFFMLRPEKELPGNLFSSSYEKGGTMRFQDFLREFPKRFDGQPADKWLESKIMFEESEAHNILQTAAGAWEKFNGRTRMMKGLFNYETAFRRYTRLCLEDFLNDNIQYAEIRPNFMTSNQLYLDEGSPVDNWGIMGIIVDEVEKFQAWAAARDRYFGGLKVIYCTPRSFAPSSVEAALEECVEFKKRWPKWIAGFDLVGEEAKGKPIRDFIPEFLRFRKKCDIEGLDIPFLFHCGETLDIGTETDHNLIDALLLNSKRIGHGFALKQHPYIMEQMKVRGICVEVCPISNEILGLTPRIGGHAMYPLLANNVHCTVNSDNGTIFRSTLSHDFYQVIVGKESMGIYGWKQLVLWSLEHACLSQDEYRAVRQEWEKLWQKFLMDVDKEFGAELDAQS